MTGNLIESKIGDKSTSKLEKPTQTENTTELVVVKSNSKLKCQSQVYLITVMHSYLLKEL